MSLDFKWILKIRKKVYKRNCCMINKTQLQFKIFLLHHTTSQLFKKLKIRTILFNNNKKGLILAFRYRQSFQSKVNKHPRILISLVVFHQRKKYNKMLCNLLMLTLISELKKVTIKIFKERIILMISKILRRLFLILQIVTQKNKLGQ